MARGASQHWAVVFGKFPADARRLASPLLRALPCVPQSSAALLSSYTPSSLVTFFHGRSRYGHVNTFELGTNTDWTNYGEGVAYATVVFVALGLFLFLVAAFTYCGACCHCCWTMTRGKPIAAGAR